MTQAFQSYTINPKPMSRLFSFTRSFYIFKIICRQHKKPFCSRIKQYLFFNPT